LLQKINNRKKITEGFILNLGFGIVGVRRPTKGAVISMLTLFKTVVGG
jgi:hypothetical protein